MQEAASLQGSPSTCMGMALDVVSTTCRHWHSRSPWPPTCKAACERAQSERRVQTEGWMEEHSSQMMQVNQILRVSGLISAGWDPQRLGCESILSKFQRADTDIQVSTTIPQERICGAGGLADTQSMGPVAALVDSYNQQQHQLTRDVMVKPITSMQPSSWRCGSKSWCSPGLPQGMVPAQYLRRDGRGCMDRHPKPGQTSA